MCTWFVQGKRIFFKKINYALILKNKIDKGEQSHGIENVYINI